jgi:hypothetical protein
MVRPAVVDLPRAGAQYAISSLFEEYEERTSIYCYDVQCEDEVERTAGRARVRTGRIHMTSRITHESDTLCFAALHLGDHVINGAVRRYESQEAYAEFTRQMLEAFDRADFMALMRLMESAFDGAGYTLASLFRDEQRRIVNLVLEHLLAEVEATYRQLYEHHAPLMRFLGTLAIPSPRPLALLGGFVLNARFRDALDDDPPDLPRIRTILEEARSQSVQLDRVRLSFSAEAALRRVAARLAAEPRDADVLEQMHALAALLRDLPFGVELSDAQNAYWALLQDVRPEMAAAADRGDESARHWLSLFDALGEQLDVRVS